MSEKLIGEMDDQAFEQMMNAFIDRPTPSDEEIPAELVFALLDKAEDEYPHKALGQADVRSCPTFANLPLSSGVGKIC